MLAYFNANLDLSLTLITIRTHPSSNPCFHTSPHFDLNHHSYSCLVLTLNLIHPLTLTITLTITIAITITLSYPPFPSMQSPSSF